MVDHLIYWGADQGADAPAIHSSFCPCFTGRFGAGKTQPARQYATMSERLAKKYGWF